MKTSSLVQALVVGMVTACSGVSLHAALSTPLDIEFSGGTAPASPTLPWVRSTFTTEAGGTVLFTLTADHLTNPERVNSFYFNFNDALNVQNLNFQLVSGGAFTLPTVNLGQNAFMADGDGRYDIRLNFAPVAAANQAFGQGDTLTFRLSYTSAIDASQFGYLSQPSGGHGPFYAAALIQDTPGGQSGWIGGTTFDVFEPVPEASPLLASASLVGLLGVSLWPRARRWFARRF